MYDHLQFHHGKWRVRLLVPDAVIDVVGKRVLTRTTGTADHDRAVRLSVPILKEFRRVIERASETKKYVHLRHSDRSLRSSEWYTPEFVFDAMGCEFDMDVASPGADVVPWIPAREHVTENSLEREWRGFIYMNPPFGMRFGMKDWLEKFIAHGDGVAMLPASTYTRWWLGFAKRVDIVLLVSGYVNFLSPTKRNSRVSFGSTLFGVGPRAVAALHRASANGLGHVFHPSGGNQQEVTA